MSVTAELTISQDTRNKFKTVIDEINNALVRINPIGLIDALPPKLVHEALTYKKKINDSIDKDIFPFFYEDKNSAFRLDFRINAKSIIDELEIIKNKLVEVLIEIDLSLPDELSLIFNELIFIDLKFRQYIYTLEMTENIQSEAEQKIDETFEGFERVKLAFENQKITDAYEKIYKDLDLLASCYQIAFWGALIIGGLCGLISMNQYPSMHEGNFWFSKILIFSLTITFGTFFIRRSAHLRKQSDQLKREAWEMDALPVFIAGLDQQSKNEIIKELVPKYFGKEIDQSINNKMADLVNEQIKTSLEVFKTSTDIVKSMKPSVAKEDDVKN